MGGVFFVSVIIEVLEPYILQLLPLYVGKLYGVSVIPYLWMFLLSAYVAEKRENIVPFIKKYWWTFFVLLLADRLILHLDVRMNTYYGLFYTILLFCSILGFAYQFPQLNIKTDFSYGVYIYHMTIVNALIVLGFVGQKWTFWAVLLGSCLLAWISTKTIGQLSLKKKKQLAAY